MATISENWWGCAAGRWKLVPKRSREKWNLRPRSNCVRIGSSNTPKDSFGVGGWEKVPQKDRVQSPECQKGGQNGGTSISPNIEGVPSPGISQTFLWMKSFIFRLKFHWSLFLRVQLTKSQQWFRWFLGAEQAPSYYLNHCWPRSLTHICGTRGRRVVIWVTYFIWNFTGTHPKIHHLNAERCVVYK